MTELVFSFDTEDFTSSRAADAIVREAELFREEGIRGCFCMVGLLAGELKRNGRTDVLEALKYHEIDFHTYGHTVHPMIDEYTDIESFDEAHRLLTEQEGLGIEYVKDYTGRDRIFAAVPPGNQKNYAAMYAYADMGIPIYADTVCDPNNGSGMFYCDIYHMEYVTSLESFLLHWDDDAVAGIIEELAARPKAVVYTHPNVSVAKSWWDIDNYDKENLAEFGHWIPAIPRPEEETREFLDNIRRFVRMLKADGRFVFTTYEQQAEKLSKRPTRIIHRRDISKIRKIAAEIFPTEGEDSLSVADAFYACAAFLNGKDKFICGRTKGFLEKPFAIDKNVTVTKADMIASAKNITAGDFIPLSLNVGDKKIGPADWLRAAVAVLDGADSVELSPDKALPSLDFLPDLRDQCLKGTWRHSDDFEDRYLSERLRLQSWTMRF